MEPSISSSGVKGRTRDQSRSGLVADARIARHDQSQTGRAFLMPEDCHVRARLADPLPGGLSTWYGARPLERPAYHLRSLRAALARWAAVELLAVGHEEQIALLRQEPDSGVTRVAAMARASSQPPPSKRGRWWREVLRESPKRRARAPVVLDSARGPAPRVPALADSPRSSRRQPGPLAATGRNPLTWDERGAKRRPGASAPMAPTMQESHEREEGLARQLATTNAPCRSKAGKSCGRCG